MDHLDAAERAFAELTHLLSDDLFDRYLAGAISPSERLAVEQIVRASPQMATFVTQLRESQRSEDHAVPLELGRIRELLVERIGFAPHHLSLETSRAVQDVSPVQSTRAENTQGALPRRKPVMASVMYADAARTISRRGIPRWAKSLPVVRSFGVGMSAWGYAGVGVIVAGVIGMSWWAKRTPVADGASALAQVYVTKNAQRTNIKLPDGSLVELNVASRLEVPVDYAAGNRTLRLSGEALFTVQQSHRTPFIVNTGAATTRVLGTSFVVRHYTTDTTTTVAVQDGKVSVASLVLTAGTQAQISPNAPPRITAVSSNRFTFADGVLTLTDVSMPDAIVELDRWYDADIRLGDPVLATRRVTGDCASGSLADLQNILELTYSIRAVRDGRTLTLYPK